MNAASAIALLTLILPKVLGAGEHVRGSYVANWSLCKEIREGGRHISSFYKQGMCTHLFYAFADIGEGCTLQPHAANSDMEESMYGDVTGLKRQQPDLKVLLSFGGWGISHNRAGIIRKMLESPALRSIFIDSIIKLLRKHNFDGFDFCYEPSFPNGMYKGKYKDDLASFMRELRRAVDKEAAGKERLLLTAAVYGYVNELYDIPSIVEAFDFVNVMAYDHAAGSGVTKLNSALYVTKNNGSSVSGSIACWVSRGIPKGKLIMGLSAYGRGWILQDRNTRDIGAPTKGVMAPLQQFGEPGVASYHEILCLLGDGTIELLRDPKSKAPYLIKDDLWLGYEDVWSFKAKLAWLKEQGLAGAIVWHLNHDDFAGEGGREFPLHWTVEKELRSSRPGTASNPVE